MSKSKTLIELAAAFAVGEYTTDQLHEILGDENAVSHVVSYANGFLAAGIASNITKSVLDTDVATNITDTIDETIDSVGSALNVFNPFS